MITCFILGIPVSTLPTGCFFFYFSICVYLSILYLNSSLQIEDVSVVESGPHLAKKEAYVIVRHVKFGLPKKGGVSKKKLQDTACGQEASDSNEEDQNQSSAESEFETEEEVLFDGEKHMSHFMGR